MLKKHWPVLFTAIAVLISIVLMLFAANSTDTGYAILASLITFMFLFPVAGALAGGWYGWKINSLKKWALPFIGYVLVILYLFMWNILTQSELLDVESYILIGAPTCLSCLT